MRKSTCLIALFVAFSTLGLGCLPSTLQSTTAFEPRSYPYIPELGPDAFSANATPTTPTAIAATK